MCDESGNPLDGDRYTWEENGGDVMSWLEGRMAALERRVGALERRQPAEQTAERKMVMLHWKGEALQGLNVTTMYVKPDAPAIAVRLLRARSAAWVDAEAAEGVIAEVLSWHS